MLDKKLFVNLMTGLCDMYDKRPSEFIFNIYYDALKEFEYSAVEAAVKKVIATYKYNTLPKPCDILEYLQGTQEDTAMIAWLAVRDAIENYGYYYSISFDDPVISHCIFQMGGWMEISQVLNKDILYVEKEFLELYRLFAKRGIEKPMKLPGYIEVVNRAKGYIEHIPEVILITTKAKNVKLLEQERCNETETIK